MHNLMKSMMGRKDSIVLWRGFLCAVFGAYFQFLLTPPPRCCSGVHPDDPDPQGLPACGGGQGPRTEREGESQAARCSAQRRGTIQERTNESADGQGTIRAQHRSHG